MAYDYKTNVRPADMARINTPALAEAFIEETQYARCGGHIRVL